MSLNRIQICMVSFICSNYTRGERGWCRPTPPTHTLRRVLGATAVQSHRGVQYTSIIMGDWVTTRVVVYQFREGTTGRGQQIAGVMYTPCCPMEHRGSPRVYALCNPLVLTWTLGLSPKTTRTQLYHTPGPKNLNQHTPGI